METLPRAALRDALASPHFAHVDISRSLNRVLYQDENGPVVEAWPGAGEWCKLQGTLGAQGPPIPVSAAPHVAKLRMGNCLPDFCFHVPSLVCETFPRVEDLIISSPNLQYVSHALKTWQHLLHSMDLTGCRKLGQIPVEIGTVVQALIVLFIAAPPLVRTIFFLPSPERDRRKREKARQKQLKAQARAEGGVA